MTSHPARTPKTERWLDQLGVTWTFDPDLPLAKIDQAASLANQVRHTPLDHTIVERYAADMRDGDTFPAVIIDATTHALLGGNHRHAAVRAANHTTTPAYLVTGTPATLLRIAVEDNRNHGLPTTAAERLDHAIALINAGHPQGDAARITGVSQPKLTIALGARAASTRLEGDPAAPKFTQLPEAKRYELSRITNDDVFRAAVDLTIAAGIPTTEVRKLTAALNATNTDDAMRLIGQSFEDYDERITEMGGNVRKRGSKARADLDKALTTITGLTTDEVVAGCPNGDVAAILAQRIMRAAAVLQATHGALLTMSQKETIR